MSGSGATSDSEDGTEQGHERERGASHLIRLIKPVVVGSEAAGPVDSSIVSARFYSAFNYSILSRVQETPALVLGVTSPGKGEGKTLVASNLAVSLATVQDRRTIVVDLNIEQPVLHHVFGVHPTPGLLNALLEPSICVATTRIPNLFVLPAGKPHASPLMPNIQTANGRRHPGATNPSFGLEHVAEFRNVIYSLRQEFDFIIVDMPAAKNPSVPTLLTHQMDGLLVVINLNRTRQEEIDRIFQRVQDKQIFGFVFNRVQEEDMG